jgi:hypothetical protein
MCVKTDFNSKGQNLMGHSLYALYMFQNKNRACLVGFYYLFFYQLKAS